MLIGTDTMRKVCTRLTPPELATLEVAFVAEGELEAAYVVNREGHANCGDDYEQELLAARARQAALETVQETPGLTKYADGLVKRTNGGTS